MKESTNLVSLYWWFVADLIFPSQIFPLVMFRFSDKIKIPNNTIRPFAKTLIPGHEDP